MVKTHDVVKSASVAREIVGSFVKSENKMKSRRYPTVTMVKYNGLSSRLVNS